MDPNTPKPRVPEAERHLPDLYIIHIVSHCIATWPLLSMASLFCHHLPSQCRWAVRLFKSVNPPILQALRMEHSSLEQVNHGELIFRAPTCPCLVEIGTSGVGSG